MKTLPTELIEKYKLQPVPVEDLDDAMKFYAENEDVQIYRDEPGALWMLADEDQNIVCTIFGGQSLQFDGLFLLHQPVERINKLVSTIDEVQQFAKYYRHE